MEIGPITPVPTWKLYRNPFYHHHHKQKHQRTPLPQNLHLKSMGFTSSLQAELDLAKTMIGQLKASVLSTQAQLESERKVRQRAELANRKLLGDLREARAAITEGLKNIERERADLGKEQAKVEKMKREVEEEKRMLRVAGAWREERVKMRLKEGHFLEERLVDLRPQGSTWASCTGVRSGGDVENPHIRRGMKGFVEFTRAVRQGAQRKRGVGMRGKREREKLRQILNHKRPIGLFGIDGI
ncbi:hypothetical protein AMTRI_Chr09g17840 [Amborella trichopoda]|uniref:Uncharacterized protein n=1 Tax=Amborella trichopoda TaxID=13333 RepID=W1PE98_AMBTC|nr:protein BRANCHLESS TRICHOME [Amborella trichopoda]ERN08257.1 hypothetical protein AMTR_s00018p00253870 [Amborella trichopoda]|eukprot:XP_006846582.3 protein BRANCHLESS TRICHOME [Amborella trichopoda]